MIFIGVAGCAATPPARPPTLPLPVLATKKSVVVADFEGGSIPPQKQTQFWSRALANLFIADLRASDNLRVVDRQHLIEVLQEQRLSASALSDPETRLRLGRIMRADLIIFGTYLLLGDTAVLTARIDNVETGEVVKSEQLSGKIGDLPLLSRQLSITFLRGLDPVLDAREEKALPAAGGPPAEAVRFLREGLDYELRGMYEEAIELYTKALALHRHYPEAREHLEQAAEKAARQ